MKAKQLIQELLKLDPNTTVIVSSDMEGNNYSVLRDVYSDDGNLSYNGQTSTSAGLETGVIKPGELDAPIFKRPAVILFPI